MVLTMLVGWWSRSLRMDSTTLSSVDVVSRPQNADQSFATSPAPITSLPRLTVPATRGICAVHRRSHRYRDAKNTTASTDVCVPLPSTVELSVTRLEQRGQLV